MHDSHREVMAWMHRNLPSFFAPWLGFSLCLAWTGAGRAPRAHAQDPQSAVVMVLSAAVDATTKGRDQRFAEELGLALEGLVVRTQTADAWFTDAPLAQQLSYVRALGSDQRIAAILWLREADSSVLLHLVALQTERALVRIVKSAPHTALEAELALLARELLGEAYLFSGDAELAAPIDAAIETVRSTVKQRAARWELGAFGLGSGGVLGQVGPHLQLGAGAGAGLRIWQRAWGLAALHALAGPSGERDTIEIRGVEWGGSLSAVYRVALRNVELGPLVRASLSRRRLATRTAQGAQRDLEAWSGRVAAGAEASVALAAYARLYLDVTLGAQLLETTVKSRADGTTLLRTPNADFAARLGLVLRFQ